MTRSAFRHLGNAVLIAMAGLPGTGKSSVADGLARALGGQIVSVDPIEAALWRAGIDRMEPTGLAAYVVAETIAEAALALGQTVIVDAVNAVEPARAQWRALAARHGARLCFIETVCPDADVHRARLERRQRGLDASLEPHWADVVRRIDEVEPWDEERLVVDTMAPLEACVATALAYATGDPKD